MSRRLILNKDGKLVDESGNEVNLDARNTATLKVCMFSKEFFERPMSCGPQSLVFLRGNGESCDVLARCALDFVTLCGSAKGADWLLVVGEHCCPI